MWGKAVIGPSDAEEVRQEPAPSDSESLEEGNEEAGTPRDEPFVEEFEAEGTPRNAQKLHHLPRKTVKWGMPPPKHHVLHLYNLKLILEYLRLRISKSLELLGK
jgi:hypothetical protein